MAIRINNRAADAAAGPWGSVNLTAQRTRLASAVEADEPGARAAVREMYAKVDGFDAPSQDWHFPHHVLRGDMLVMHVAGCQAAVQRGSQMNDRAVMAHMAKHMQALVDAGRVQSSMMTEE